MVPRPSLLSQHRRRTQLLVVHLGHARLRGLGIHEIGLLALEAEHDGVTVEVQAFQQEELQRTLIPNALQAGEGAAPDLFMVRAEGEIKAQVEAGYLRDLTDDILHRIYYRQPGEEEREEA